MFLAVFARFREMLAPVLGVYVPAGKIKDGHHHKDGTRQSIYEFGITATIYISTRLQAEVVRHWDYSVKQKSCCLPEFRRWG